ncbi:DUF982 domain-containing protein [Ensifer sp. IC4062]|nr:DUF982 domain-containing protein [Ensifer sp. IC4062]MCA1441704.1 DUF982 domain-containing protein [Ensifer sp. IC4062]
MEQAHVRQPVSVFVGLGFPAEIHGLSEAYTWLNEWPPSKRNPAHAIALNACKAAIAGEIDAEIARTALVACARRANLLAPDAGTVLAAARSSKLTV